MINLMILMPFFFAALVPILYRLFNKRFHIGWLVLLLPVGVFIYLLKFISITKAGETWTNEVGWLPSFGLNFTAYVDGLSLIFGLLITGVGSLVILYSIYYMSRHREELHNFYVYLMLFMGAMLGVVFSDNVIVLYVFWELTSISSFLLIAYWYQRKKSRNGAQKSMLITIFGGLSMLAGLLLLSIITDTYSIREMISQADSLPGHVLFIPAMILVLLGAFTKSAQFPFSLWLPDAMEAPTPISAYLHSATMVKAGIYLVARLTPVFGGDAIWFWTVSIVGMITLLYGSWNAVRQKDLKALLAYSTISQLGLIMSLLGLGSAAVYFGYGEESKVYAIAIMAALFHLVNHSTFKGSLFMVVGIIDHETGTRNLQRLGGLMSLMPISFTIAVIGSFSMAGLPPFNGFLSKEMFFTGVLNASGLEIFGMETFGMLFPAVAWGASVLTFVYCMVLVFKTFLGDHKPEMLAKVAHEPPIGMLIPPAVLAIIVVLIFFFPNVLADYILEPAFISVLPDYTAAGGLGKEISAWHGFNTELLMTIGVVLFGTALYKLLPKWSKVFAWYPQSLTFNSMYNWMLQLSEVTSAMVTKRYMTGYTRDYLAYIFLFFIFIVGGSLWVFDGFIFDMSGDSPVSIYEAAMIIGMVSAALIALFSQHRLTSIIAVGALGYLVSILFVIFQAPDLALTQLVVETVTVALFLLCFYHLPELRKEVSKVRFKLTNMLISIGAGTTVTLVALSANGTRLFEKISGYFEDSYALAGAKNIVNATLVDFRGLDTMVEVAVLCIAGLAVFTLVKVNVTGREKK
ncbi:MAG: Na+/H+ antiporter subunit A [Bacillus sp. (in: firmicutes)]